MQFSPTVLVDRLKNSSNHCHIICFDYFLKKKWEWIGSKRKLKIWGVTFIPFFEIFINELVRFLKITYLFFKLPEPMIAKSTFKNFDTQLTFGPRSRRDKECDCVKKHGRFMKSRNTEEILKFINFVSKIVLTYCEKKRLWSKIFLRSLQQYVQIVYN